MNPGLNPRAGAFVPAAKQRVHINEYPDAAPKLSITQEVLNNQQHLSPSLDVVEGGTATASAAILSVTNEVLWGTHELSSGEDHCDYNNRGFTGRFGAGNVEGLGGSDCGDSRHGEGDGDEGQREQGRDRPVRRMGFGGGMDESDWMSGDDWPGECDCEGEQASAEVSGQDGGRDGFRASTPVAAGRGRPRNRESPIRPRGPRLTARDWSFMPGRRNRRRRRNLRRRISYSDEGEVTVPPEENKKRTGLRWKQTGPRSLKYVDDQMTLSKVNMDSAIQIGMVGGKASMTCTPRTSSVGWLQGLKTEGWW